VTSEEALASFRDRWAHPPLDVRDVEERIALRYQDDATPPRITAVAQPPAVRIFREHADGKHHSTYVHRVADVDAALDRIAKEPRP
jgi:hypothetical protein